MPKTIKLKLEDKLTYESLYRAYMRSKEKKTAKLEILQFEIDLETQLVSILEQIKNGTYHFGKYRQFVIYEPKKRIIQALPYRDRIVHQWYIGEFIKPYILPRFIRDTYACIDGRGIHQAVRQLQKYMRIMKRKMGSYYFLKCDIRQFFYSIDRDILFSLLSRLIRDEKLRLFTKQIIYENAVGDQGIPIGNYTSQFFANIYLTELDRYVKHVLKAKYYIRYMDDFVLLARDKEQAKAWFCLIAAFLKNRLHLSLNDKSRYHSNRMGIDFCGFRIFETHLLLRKRSKLKMRKQIKTWNYLYDRKQLDLKRVQMSWNSWVAHSNHASCYHLQQKMYRSIVFHKCLSFYPRNNENSG